jgi:hypothetical protein
VYLDTSWIRVFMIFYLIVADLNSFSYRRLSIVKRSCRSSRRRDINENIHERASDSTIFSDCLRSRAKWLRRCWRDQQKDDTSSWKEIVFYEKYRELASHSCQTKDSWDAWSEFEFWEKIISFFFVVMIDFTSIQWYLLLIDWSIIFDSSLFRVRCVFAKFVKILLMKILDQIVSLNIIDIYLLIFDIWSTQSFDKIL